MKKTELLILGYSLFLKRRVIPAIKKIKNIEYCICSKSNKINLKEKILFKDYDKALSKATASIVYISLINSLHYKYAKKALTKGFNVIVDKPITTSLHETKKLLSIAKKKGLLLSEANLYNYHNVFDKMIRLCEGTKNISHIQSNFNVPLVKNPKKIFNIKGDCVMDMSPYAASIIRLFTDKKIKKLQVFKEYFKKFNAVKGFFILARFRQCTYFGNFGFDREYVSQITFFTKNKIILSPNRIFALPPNKNLSILLKKNNKIKKLIVKKDDCIYNFFNKVIYAFKNKNFKGYYNKLLDDAKIREKINLF